MDTRRFRALQQTTSAYAHSKGVTAKLQMRAVRSAADHSDVHLFLRVFRVTAGQETREYLPAATFNPEAPDVEAQIIDAIEVAARALYST